MAKNKTVYVCSQCGYESPKWYGKCPSCGEWDTLNEEQIIVQPAAKTPENALRSFSGAFKLSQIDSSTELRYDTGVGELNRVLGGGLVKGSLVLLCGDPGIGKSTLLLQICEKLANKMSVLYVSGEESAYQLKMRAKRLGVSPEKLLIMTETDAESVCEYIRAEKPDVVIHEDRLRHFQHIELGEAEEDRQNDREDGEDEEEDHEWCNHEVRGLVAPYFLQRPLEHRHFLARNRLFAHLLLSNSFCRHLIFSFFKYFFPGKRKSVASRSY